MYRTARTRKIDQTGTFKGAHEIYSNRSIIKYQPSSKGIIAIVSDPFDSNEPLATERIKYRFDSRGLLRKKNKFILIGEKIETLVEGDFDVTDVSTQGEKIVFSSTANDDDHELQDIYSLDANSKAISKITEGTGTVSAICLSPEGKVAYVGHRQGYIPWAVDKLIFPETGTSVEIGMNASSSVLSDLFVSDVQKLLYDSGKYYLIGQTGGSASIFSYDGAVKRLTELKLVVREFSVKSGKLAYVYTSSEKPSVLFFGKELDLNPEIKGATPHRIEADGKEAWLLLSHSKHPNILSIHGGPHSAYGYAYSIEFNFLLQNGFNVIFGNPTGSGGYGEDFARECVGDWCADILPQLKHVGFLLLLRFRLHSSRFGRFCRNPLPSLKVASVLNVASLGVSVLPLHASLSACNRDMPLFHSSIQTAVW